MYDYIMRTDTSPFSDIIVSTTFNCLYKDFCETKVYQTAASLLQHVRDICTPN